MAEEVKYNNTLVSGRADETLTYTKYVKDESSGKSTKELLDEKVNKTDQLGTTQIADNAVTNEKLAEHSVDNTKLSHDSVSYDKIQNDAVITEKIQDNAVTTEKVEEKAITNTKLGDQSVDGRVVREASLETKHFANESVTTEKVARKSITKDKLADNSVDASQLVDGCIGNSKLFPDSVTTEKIKDSSVTNEKVADDTLGIEKFDPEFRKIIQAATGLPDYLSQMIQDVDKSVKQLNEKNTDLQSKVDDNLKKITINKSAQDEKNASLDKNMTKLNTRDDQITETLKNIVVTGGASVASAVTYDNTTSQLTSANIQGAVDELQGAKIDKTSILQEPGEDENKVMSQKAVSAKLSDISDKLDKKQDRFNNISEEAVESIVEEISIQNNEGEEIAHIDNNISNFRNLQSNGLPVLTKEDVDILNKNFSESESDDAEEQIWADNDYDLTAPDKSKEFVRIGNYGVKSKSFQTLDGSKVMLDNYETVSNIRNRRIKEMKEWNKLGVGMFIHWGVYSVLEGHYSGKNINGENINFTSSGIAEWILRLAKIPEGIYKSYQSMFTADKWNTDEVAKIAYNAGMKYIVITAKHHEGFVLYDSKFASWCTKTSSARNTLLDELKKSCEKFGLKFCLYFSQTTDWTTDGGYGQDFKNNENKDPYTNEQHLRYINETISVIKEMIERFDPYVLWYDAPSDKDNFASLKFLDIQLANYPQVIVNDRLFNDFHAGDFAIGEGNYYFGDRPYAENCYTINGSWGYNKKYDTEDHTISAAKILEQYIIESRARGQNALINIGPKGNGEIPSLIKARLSEISTFIKKYGFFFSTEPVNTVSFPNWGRVIKCGNTLKCFVWDKSKRITISGINTTFVKSVYVYDTESTDNLSIVDEYNMIISNIPSKEESEYPAVIDIEFSNHIVAEKFSNVISADNNKLNVSAFVTHSAYPALMGYGTDTYQLGSWTDISSISSVFKYEGETTDKTITFTKTLQEKNDISFTITLVNISNGKKQIINVINDTAEQTVSLEKGIVYEINIRKEVPEWYNLKDIIFS